MKEIELVCVDHDVKVGRKCGHKVPNVTESSVFVQDGNPVGFYLTDITGKMKQLLEIANKEFLTDNVPKGKLRRSDTVTKYYKLKNTREPQTFGENSRIADKLGVIQCSTILGSVPPRNQLRRPYPLISRIHQVESAQTFIKAMILLCSEAEKMIKKYLPHIYTEQKKLLCELVPEKWRFSPLFTSSISNYNFSTPYHRDTGNIQKTVNAIFIKKFDATGGCLNVPDYDLTVECAGNSMLCYPAWQNVHGVTPIVSRSSEGYRNSFIFYPLNGFDDGRNRTGSE